MIQSPNGNTALPPLYISWLNCPINTHVEVQMSHISERLVGLRYERKPSYQIQHGFTVREYTTRQPSLKRCFFLWTSSTLSVFVLSTKRTYQQIRHYCSESFPRLMCAAMQSDLIPHPWTPKEVSGYVIRRLTGAILESKVKLRGLPPDHLEIGLVYREISVICNGFPEDYPEGLLIKFKDRAVLPYHGANINWYAQILSISVSAMRTIIPAIEGLKWKIDLPNNSSLAMQSTSADFSDGLLSQHISTQNRLSNEHVNLVLSDRLFSNAYHFSLSFPCMPNLDPMELRKGAPPTVDNVINILSNLPVEKAALSDAIKDKKVMLTCHTLTGQHEIPLIDCIEGEISVNELGVQKKYFKVGSLWYQTEDDFASRVQETLRKIEATDCILSENSPGYLYKAWTGDEVEYGNQYLGNDQLHNIHWLPVPRGLVQNVELADLLGFANNDELFVYQLKAHFDQTVTKGAAQLINSAKIIHSHINKDEPTVQAYLQQRGFAGFPDPFKGKKEKKIHFVLAFPLPANVSIHSHRSTYAQMALIEAKKEIESLGFVFNVCVIKMPTLINMLAQNFGQLTLTNHT